jgi:hypothetical protein
MRATVSNDLPASAFLRAARSADRVAGRIVRTPGMFVPAMAAITLLGLWFDSLSGIRLQLLFALCAWIFLAIAFRYQSADRRAQVTVVVLVATCAEIIGSIIWGVYTYRLGNLPLFVPPGHGLVYLTGVAISDTSWFRRRPRVLINTALVLALGWAILGLTVLPATDVSGAIGATTLAIFLIVGRAPAIYAGVFLAVAFLEIYGTAMGTWTWAAEVPGLGMPQGNPPSGAASGYVFFDIAALALAPYVLRLARVGRRHRGGAAATPVRGEA